MLRKRTSFKPNPNQVAAPKPSPPPTQQNNPSNGATEAAPIPQEAQSKEREIAARDVVDTAPSLPQPVTTTNEISDESSKRVHEAINQLTGQKFEPIKTISLRNSANKNVKLKDLLFFNPPLTKDQKRHRKNERKRIAEELNKSKETNDSTNTDSNQTSMESDEPSLVPKVKLGPDGKLILDESSTIINRKNVIKAQEAIVEDNEEIISRTNYDSYRRKPTSTSQTKWSIDDTQKFYQALTIFGTDFSMMESLLFEGHRSRTELHKKFKREERLNKAKIDIALTNRISLDSEELDELRDVFYKT